MDQLLISFVLSSIARIPSNAHCPIVLFRWILLIPMSDKQDFEALLESLSILTDASEENPQWVTLSFYDRHLSSDEEKEDEGTLL